MAVHSTAKAQNHFLFYSKFSGSVTYPILKPADGSARHSIILHSVRGPDNNSTQQGKGTASL